VRDQLPKQWNLQALSQEPRSAHPASNAPFPHHLDLAVGEGRSDGDCYTAGNEVTCHAGGLGGGAHLDFLAEMGVGEDVI
jgi:hypothetical protein